MGRGWNSGRVPIDRVENPRVNRLRKGDWSFGCVPGEEVCDEFCDYPTHEEIKDAGINPQAFTLRRR